jgi:hypothetical protein
MDPNGKDAAVAALPSSRRPSNVWLIILAALFIIVPFLTWYGTWFGRDLSDNDIGKYLADEKNPRHVQHALSQVEARMEKGDPNVRRFYPQIVAVSKSPIGEIRKTAAWVMGQDHASPEFHQALAALLADSEPLVRRNAALQLVRFGDPAGRPELRAMLQPFEARSPIGGTVVSILPQGSRLRAGGLLARIRDSSNTVQEFRSPVDGAIASLAIKEGETLAAGQPLVQLTPDRATVSDALRALAYVGTKDDLSLIEPFSLGSSTGDAEIRYQAMLTAKAIRDRSQSQK